MYTFICMYKQKELGRWLKYNQHIQKPNSNRFPSHDHSLLTLAGWLCWLFSGLQRGIVFTFLSTIWPLAVVS